MSLLDKGAKKFQSDIFQEYQPLFEQLANGQSPKTLFVTCSDSRIDPNLITQTNPGELFVLRNAGNIVPSYQTKDLASAAVIEYAVQALGVEEIIVCGHSDCGAMKGLRNLEAISDSLPVVKSFLEQNFEHGFTDETMELDELIVKNVKYQLESLLTFPFVKEKVDAGNLKLHGWVYSIKQGAVVEV